MALTLLLAAWAADWADQVDTARQEQVLRVLSGDLAFHGEPIRSRHVEHPDHDRVLTFLRQELDTIPGLSVREQPFGGEVPGVNLIATLEGTDPEASPVVLSAHYDSTADFDESFNPAVDASPGADDDASGCAVVLEAARLISGAPQRRRNVEFVFFDAEEAGLLGSSAHVASRAGAVHAMLSVDSVGSNPADGWLFLVVASTATELESVFTDQFAEQTTQALTELRPVGAEFIGPPRSDHGPFLDAGHPAMHLGQFPLPTSYHTADDSFERLDLAFVADATAVVTASIHALAEAPLEPERSCGCASRPMAWGASLKGRR